MIVARVHQIEEGSPATSLRDLVIRSGLPYPLRVEHSIRLELIKSPMYWPTSGMRFSYKNLPERSYTVEDAPLENILEILAWEASEWEAIELARFYRRRGLIG